MTIKKEQPIPVLGTQVIPKGIEDVTPLISFFLVLSWMFYLLF